MSDYDNLSSLLKKQSQEFDSIKVWIDKSSKYYEGTSLNLTQVANCIDDYFHVIDSFNLTTVDISDDQLPFGDIDIDLITPEL
ncbi:hypothetical protein QTN25_000283 [Entamoeba marina]